MGRGRAKAKQTKVARELKYSSGALDINALTAELSKGDVSPAGSHEADQDQDDLDDEFVDAWADDEDEDRTGS
jgi:hypothetical protein